MKLKLYKYLDIKENRIQAFQGTERLKIVINKIATVSKVIYS